MIIAVISIARYFTEKGEHTARGLQAPQINLYIKTSKIINFIVVIIVFQQHHRLITDSSSPLLTFSPSPFSLRPLTSLHPSSPPPPPPRLRPPHSRPPVPSSPLWIPPDPSPYPPPPPRTTALWHTVPSSQLRIPPDTRPLPLLHPPPQPSRLRPPRSGPPVLSSQLRIPSDPRLPSIASCSVYLQLPGWEWLPHVKD